MLIVLVSVFMVVYLYYKMRSNRSLLFQRKGSNKGESQSFGQKEEKVIREHQEIASALLKDVVLGELTGCGASVVRCWFSIL